LTTPIDGEKIAKCSRNAAPAPKYKYFRCENRINLLPYDRQKKNKKKKLKQRNNVTQRIGLITT